MNYAEIKIGGGTRIIRFGLKPLGDCIEHYDHDIQAFMRALERNPFKAVPMLFYYGLKWGAEEAGKIPDFDQTRVYTWLEELPGGIQDDLVTKVIQMFIRSVYDNVPSVKQYIDALPEESKKNLIGT